MRSMAIGLLLMLAFPCAAKPRQKPLDGPALNTLAIRYLDHGRLTDAARVATRSWAWCQFNHQPGSPIEGRAYETFGLVQLQKHHFKSAEESYEDAAMDYRKAHGLDDYRTKRAWAAYSPLHIKTMQKLFPGAK